MAPATVDVVIPVFRGLRETRDCIESVLRAINSTEARIVVVDDCTPEPALRAYLEVLHRDGAITLLTHEQNRGFVASVNLGMVQGPDRDVVLLNSDTIVSGNWIDRLRRCVYSASDVASATPFSNNGSICSFPEICRDNPAPTGLTYDALDDVFKAHNDASCVEIPSTVGFCMYIRRSCLDAIGLFDEARFGRGYGEENDFCCRATLAGWRHHLCADTFVFHRGGVSFLDEASPRTAAALALLREKYPNYETRVHEFLVRDPIAPFRRRIALELERARRETRLAPRARGRQGANAVPAQLHVVHDLGGGIERWLRDYCSADLPHRILVLRPVTYSEDFGSGLLLFDASNFAKPIHCWIFDSPIHATATEHPEYRDILKAIIADYQVTSVVVSSLIGHALDALRSNLPTAFICHDYYPVCPDINSHFDSPCGSCRDERLVRCATKNHDFNIFARYPAADRLKVREAFAAALQHYPVSLVTPTRAVARQLRDLHEPMRSAHFVEIPHGQNSVGGPAPEAPHEGRRMRIVVLGMLSVSKGHRLLEAALGDLLQFADLYLLGSGEVGELFMGRKGVQVIPQYTTGRLRALLSDINPDVGLLLSIWPETYSYTLTELWACRIPPVATRLGSFEERIWDGRTGYLFDPDPSQLVELLRRLDSNRQQIRFVRNQLSGLPARTAQDMADDYHRLLNIAACDTLPAPATPQPPLTRGICSADKTSQVLARIGLWKERQSLHIRLAMRQQVIQARAEPGPNTDPEVERLQLQMSALLNSRSWRVTAPLRWLYRMLGVVRSAVARRIGGR
ncbi:MAG: glycosyltransferase [Rhodocyclaceae bacterium]|nr:glycosyltransferase [Rhodocyclaceae bacterium]